MVLLLLLAGCNYPTQAENSGDEEPGATQTDVTDIPDETANDIDDSEPSEEETTPKPSPTEETDGVDATETPEAEEEDEISEGDFAEFITDFLKNTFF